MQSLGVERTMAHGKDSKVTKELEETDERWSWRGGQWPGLLKRRSTDTTLSPVQGCFFQWYYDFFLNSRSPLLLACPLRARLQCWPCAVWTFPLAWGIPQMANVNVPHSPDVPARSFLPRKLSSWTPFSASLQETLILATWKPLSRFCLKLIIFGVSVQIPTFSLTPPFSHSGPRYRASDKNFSDPPLASPRWCGSSGCLVLAFTAKSLWWFWSPGPHTLSSFPKPRPSQSCLVPWGVDSGHRATFPQAHLPGLLSSARWLHQHPEEHRASTQTCLGLPGRP